MDIVFKVFDTWHLNAVRNEILPTSTITDPTSLNGKIISLRIIQILYHYTFQLKSHR